MIYSCIMADGPVLKNLLALLLQFLIVIKSKGRVRKYFRSVGSYLKEQAYKNRTCSISLSVCPRIQGERKTN